MHQDLVYEIGVEELPASYIEPALRQLARDAEAFFKTSRLAYDSVSVAGTPRRLVLKAGRLQERKADIDEEVMGPSAKAAFGADGKPTLVAAGFAKSRGVELSDLSVKTTPKGDYVFARVRKPGRHTMDLLAEWLPQETRALSFPKSMRWGQGGPLRFARPIQWLLALYGKQPVRFSLEHLASAPQTYGHRFLAKAQPIPVKSAADFDAALKKGSVMLSQVEREEAIRQALEAACAKAGLALVADDELVSICANLVEWPGVVLGQFDPRYLALPEAIIITALREHQRIFSARGADGRLAASFLVVTNGTRKNLAGVLEGNSQVLKARLEDAKFFVEEDQKRPLESYLEDLKTVTWLEGMGSVHDKSERLRRLAEWLCIHLQPEAKADAARAASLAKCDLVTHVVGEKEYTALQGAMGSLYARVSGEAEAVALAIAEQYRPSFSGDAIPASPAGQMVALADKLDNLVGCFAAGLIPSGSQDPYALRRQAAGVVAILAAQAADLSLLEALEFTLNLHRALPRESAKLDPAAFAWLSDPAQAQALLAKLQDFLKARLEAALVEAGHSQDRVAAVLSRRHDQVREAMARAMALDQLVLRDDFDMAAQAFSRVTNILAKAGEVVAVDAGLLADGPEKLLHERFLAVRPNAERACQQGRFDLAFDELAGLRSAIDAYFAEVMVMAEDPRTRANRLSFLAQVAGTIGLIADFTKLAKR